MREPDARGLLHRPRSGHARVDRRSPLRKARRATDRFHRTARATRAGYALPPEGPLHECIAEGHGHGPGAMGFHWINGTLAGDALLDPAKPEAVLYEPRQNGKLRLIGLEYVVFADAWEREYPDTTPRLFGRDLTFVPEGNRFELPAFYQVHAWVWRHNPAGMFADFNPRVSCGCQH